MANVIKGFQYHVPTGGPVVVTEITYPLANAELTAAFPITITWTDSKTGTAKVDVSRDGGATWLVVASGITNKGFYTWTVDAPGSTDAYIRVTTPNGTDSVGPLTIKVPDDGGGGGGDDDGGTIVGAPTGLLTLTDLMTAVNDILHNFRYREDYYEMLEEPTNVVYLPRSFVVGYPNAFTFWVDGTVQEYTAYTLNADSGYLLKSQGNWTSDSEIKVRYFWKVWNDRMVIDAINSGIRYCYKKVYIDKIFTRHIVTSDVYEYPLPDDVKRVTRVEIYNTLTGKWMLQNDYEVMYSEQYYFSSNNVTNEYLGNTTDTTLVLNLNDVWQVTVGDVLNDSEYYELCLVTDIDYTTGDVTVERGYLDTAAVAHKPTKYWHKWNTRSIKFHSAPSEGRLRVSYIAAPSTLINATDPLVVVSGLPEECKDAIVYYAAYLLMQQRGNLRIRDDATRNIQGGGENATYPRDIEAAIQRLRLAADIALDKVKMHPRMYRYHT